MSDLQLNKVSREIIEQAERTMTPNQALPKAVDDYFVQRLKQDEMRHALVDSRLYDGLRQVVRSEVLPLYEQYRRDTNLIRQRKHDRKIWQYVLGTVAFLEVLQAILSKGRSLLPQVFIPTAFLHSLLGFVIYWAAQYYDDLQLARARKRLDQALEDLEDRVETDVQYDSRRELLESDLLHAETTEILGHYTSPEDFWRDYRRVREADPTLPAEVKMVNAPAFERFLRLHVEGGQSAVARQHRFNRLFVEAQEIFMARDREGYVLKHLEMMG